MRWDSGWVERRKRVRLLLHNRAGLANPRPRPFSANAERGFAVVTLRDLGDEGYGKPEYTRASLFRILAEVLQSYGIEFSYFPSVQAFLSTPNLPKKIAVLALYNEVKSLENEEIYAKPLHALEERVRDHSGRTILHPMATARVIADKQRTNAAYGAAGIAVPKLIDGSTSSAARSIFVNSNTLPGTQARIADGGEVLSTEEYNTEFIDTRMTWRDRTYFVSPRAMAAGRRLVGLSLRAAAADTGEVAARSSTTPADAELLNHLYAAHMPWMEAISDLVRRLGEMLGPGLYHHDLLLETSSQTIYVCESGFKLQNVETGWNLARIRNQAIFAHEIDPAPLRRTAYALIGELHDLGYY